MRNKKVSSVIKCLNFYKIYVDIFNIVQCDNGKKFKKISLMFLKNNDIKMINGRFRTPRTQELIEQTNEVMKNKIKRKMKAIENLR